MNFDSLSFHRGFDRGNYGNAYESTDWETWSEDQETPDDIENFNKAEFMAGLLLGFFSSYEIHEIGDCDLADQVEALRALKGDE